MDFAADLSADIIIDSTGNGAQLELSDSDLYVINGQGIMFEYGQYAIRPAGDTTSFVLSNSKLICVETWFRINYYDPNPDNGVGTLFGKYDTTNTEWALQIGVSNNFVRIIINGNYYDKPYNLNDGDWHFIEACFR